METAQLGISFQDALRNMATTDVEKFSTFFRRARKVFPVEIAQACLIYLAQRGRDKAGQKMAFWLATEVKYCKTLFDPNALSAEIARKAAAVLLETDPQFFSKFRKEAGHLTLTPRILRALHIVPTAVDITLLPWLNRLTEHPEEQIRSKALELLGCIHPNQRQIEHQVLDGNARVRANTVESLWHLRVPEATAIFQAALADSNQRVVANALVGLQLQGAPEAFAKMLDFSKSPDAAMRRAMAWCFGFVQDKRGIAPLQALAKDPIQVVHSLASRSLLLLTARSAEIATA
jgi:hypothetical protein